MQLKHAFPFENIYLKAKKKKNKRIPKKMKLAITLLDIR